MIATRCPHSALENLAGEVGADAIVIWKEAAEEANAYVLAARPSTLVVSGSPLPLIRPPASGVMIERDPARISALVPASIRLNLAAVPRAASVARLGADGLGILIAWCTDAFPDATQQGALPALLAQVEPLAFCWNQQRHVEDIAVQLGAAVNALEQAVITIDDVRLVGYVNRAASQLLDVPRGTLPASRLAQALGDLQRRAVNGAEVRATSVRLLANPQATIRDVVWTFDRSPTHLRVTTAPYDDDGVSGRIWVFDDVSALKIAVETAGAANADLQRSETRLKLATDAASIGIWTWDFVDDRIEWDERMYRLYAVAGAERRTGPTYETWRSRVHPDDVRRAEAQIAEARSRNAPYEHEFRIVLPDGAIRHIQAAAVVETDVDGRQLRQIGVDRDITGAKEYERELHRARVAADSASRAKGEFLANISHEIRTPMNAILGTALLLERSALDPQQAAYVATIRTAGRSMMALINDVLDLSKIEAGRIELDASPFVLTNVVSGILDIFTPTAAGKGIGLHGQSLPAELPALLGDATRLGQILSNLVSNAIKFTPHGEVSVAVAVERRDASSARLRFTVRDTGVGIDAAKIDRLFNSFTQADRSVHQEFGGTGLGLAISRELVTAMGGEIGVISEPGRGSEFWFVVPFELVELAPAKLSAGTSGATLDRLAGARILVVDDSQVNRDIASKLLALEGARTEPAAGGREALARLRTGPDDFDIVLMDVQMPQMDGLEATRAIRGELGLTALPVIALTAGALPSQRQRAEAAGMNDFVTKPFDLDALVATVLAHLPPDFRDRAVVSPPGANRPRGAPATAGFPPVPGVDEVEVASRLQGNRDLFYAVLRALRDEFADAAQRTRTDLSRGNRAAAVARTHKLAGIAGNASARDLAAAARALESALETAAGEDAAPLLAALDNALQPLLAGLPADLDGGSVTANAGAVAAAAIAPTELAEFRAALAKSSARALKMYRALHPQLQARWGDEALVPLTQAMAAMQFADALKQLDAWYP